MELDEKSSDSFFFGRESGDVVGDVSEWLGDVSSVGLNVCLAGARNLISFFEKPDSHPDSIIKTALSEPSQDCRSKTSYEFR